MADFHKSYKLHADGSVDAVIRSRVNRESMVWHHIDPPYKAKTTIGTVDGVTVSVTTEPPVDIWTPIAYTVQIGDTLEILTVHLPTPKLALWQSDSVSDDCPICLKPAETMLCVRPEGCRHWAHMDCINHWMMRTCCICRVSY